jgi:hypothetical protein
MRTLRTLVLSLLALSALSACVYTGATDGGGPGFYDGFYGYSSSNPIDNPGPASANHW